MYLSEGISDTLIVYILLKKLIKPFKEWDAYKLGIIDENGKKLKDPQTAEEKQAWTILDKLIWNIKKLLNKFIGKSKLAAYLTAAYLLKDSYSLAILTNQKLLKESANLEVKAKDIYILKQVMNLIPLPKEKIYLNSTITEKEIFDLYTKVFIKIYNLLNENKVSKESLLKEFHHTLMTTMGDGFINITTDDVFDPKFFVDDPYAYQFGKDPKTAEKDIKKFDKTHKPEFNDKFYKNWVKYAQDRLINIEPDKDIKDIEKHHGEIENPVILGSEVKDGKPVFYVNQNDFNLFKKHINNPDTVIENIQNLQLKRFIQYYPKEPFYIKYGYQFILINPREKQSLEIQDIKGDNDEK